MASVCMGCMMLAERWKHSTCLGLRGFQSRPLVGPSRAGPSTSGHADLKIKANSWILVATEANTGHATITAYFLGILHIEHICSAYTYTLLYVLHIFCYLLHIFCIFIAFSAYNLYVFCTFFANFMYYSTYNLHITSIYLAYILTFWHMICIWSAFDLHMIFICIWSAYISHMFCTFCIWAAYDLHTICIQSAYSLHTIGILPAYNLHINCMWPA